MDRNQSGKTVTGPYPDIWGKFRRSSETRISGERYIFLRLFGDVKWAHVVSVESAFQLDSVCNRERAEQRGCWRMVNGTRFF